MTTTSALRLTRTQWLICIIAAIGFLFDTYELLMAPLVGVPAIAELLGLPANHPTVTDWIGRLLWISALCGGVFGLLGGWFIDRFGRKRIMALSIFLYAFSPFAAAWSTSLEWFIFFRCVTFVGVCVEFVAAITWLAELFPDQRQKKIVLGTTQAFASLGGLLVTGVSAWIVANSMSLPEIAGGHATWRYTLLTGIFPAIPIALLLPFVPESPVWLAKRAERALRRPRFRELFAPSLRRTTLVSTALSACAYAAAFGALQLSPLRVGPGLPELKEQRAALKPLQAEAAGLNKELDAALPAFNKAVEEVPGLRELAAQRAKNRIAFRAAGKTGDTEKSGTLAAAFKQSGEHLDKLTAAAPDAKKALAERERILKALGDNRDKQEPHDKAVKERANTVQFWQELGGLLGRIALAVLIMCAIARGTLLRLFILPGLIFFPLTYFFLYHQGAAAFQTGILLCGFMVVAQFSYFGEYLPKVFPVHLRGTGGSFATNVGGRMFGTSAAFLTTNIVARWFSDKPGFDEVAKAAGIVAGAAFLLALVLSFLLPQQPAEESPAPASEPEGTGANYKIT